MGCGPSKGYGALTSSELKWFEEAYARFFHQQLCDGGRDVVPVIWLDTSAQPPVRHARVAFCIPGALEIHALGDEQPNGKGCCDTKDRSAPASVAITEINKVSLDASSVLMIVAGGGAQLECMLPPPSAETPYLHEVLSKVWHTNKPKCDNFPSRASSRRSGGGIAGGAEKEQAHEES